MFVQSIRKKSGSQIQVAVRTLPSLTYDLYYHPSSEFIPCLTAAARLRFVEMSGTTRPISADRTQRGWPIALSSARRNMFLSNHVRARARAPPTLRVSNATDRGGGTPACRKAEEAGAKFPAAGKRRPESTGERNEPKFRCSLIGRTIAANRIARSIRRSFGHCVTDPGPCQFCCQFRCQFRCRSRRQSLTRIIASRKRFNNFY